VRNDGNSIEPVILVGTEKRKGRRAALRLAGLLLPVLAVAAQAAGNTIPLSDMTRIGDILLPETTGWPAIRDFPQPSTPELDDGLLARMAAELPGALKVEGCRFAARDMTRPDFRSALHAGNIFAPDDDDIVYAGPSSCGGGEITIIWSHAHDPAGISSTLLYTHVLRVEGTSQPLYSSVETGPDFDAYHIARMPKDNVRMVYLHHLLQIPAATEVEQRHLILKDDTVLEWTPGSMPAPQPASDNDKPLTFPALTEGELLGTYRDGSGKVWRLVAAPRKSPSSVGWAADSEVTLTGGR
jgi:hypothetical protein